MKFKINKNLFEKYPTLFEAVVVLKNINNNIDGEEILKLLRSEESIKKKELESLHLSDHPAIKPWRDAFREFGSKPNKFSSSVEALLKRVSAGNQIPDINPLVNLYNYCSIKYMLPFGGEDFAGLYGNMELKYCSGKEDFIPIMGKENDPPYKGELAWVDKAGVTCRKWNWRQCDRTKITENTKQGYFIIDGIPPTTKEQVQRAAEDFIILAEKYLEAQGEIHWIEKIKPEVEIDIKTRTHKKDKAKRTIKKMGKKNLKLDKKTQEDAQRILKVSSSPKLSFRNESLVEFQIQKLLSEALEKSKLNKFAQGDIKVEKPKNRLFGDFSTNIALVIGNKENENPEQIAKQIIVNIPKNKLIERIKYLDGFINFSLKQALLKRELNNILKNMDSYAQIKKDHPTRLIVEFGQPNTHKMPHIGHLFSFILGESISRIASFCGFEIFRANYQGDVGPQVAKCLWAYKKNKPVIPNTFKAKAELLQKLYQEGASAYKEHVQAKTEIDELNKKIYEKDRTIRNLWKKTREWSVKFYKEFEEKLGIHYDRYYYESESADPGKRIVLDNIGTIFRKSKGATIFEGSKYGLHDRVFITKKGTPTYEAKDMALQPLKYNEWPFDNMLITTAHEQNEYFAVVFKALEILDEKFIGKLMHLGFGMVNLKSGKMSSREGNIISGISLTEQAIGAIKEIVKDKKNISIKEQDLIAEKVGIAAIKYSLLKGNPLQDTKFDFDESISFEGNSGPYLQYTYARAKSILNKSQGKFIKSMPEDIDLNEDELNILRILSEFPAAVSEACANISPNLICKYLFDLAQEFNSFYKKYKVLDIEKKKLTEKRLAITSGVAQIIKSGLYLLGIEVLERM